MHVGHATAADEFANLVAPSDQATFLRHSESPSWFGTQRTILPANFRALVTGPLQDLRRGFDFGLRLGCSCTSTSSAGDAGEANSPQKYWNVTENGALPAVMTAEREPFALVSSTLIAAPSPETATL